MNAASAARARAGIARRGHMISVRRRAGAARADVMAIVEGYAPSELVNGITSGTRKVIVSLLDLESADFPLPVVKGDLIFLGEALDIPTTIQTIDTDHRDYQGCLDITTKGT